MDRALWTVPCVVLLWAAAAAATLLPIPFVGTLLGLAFGLLSWLVIAGAVAILGVLGRRRWLGVTTTVLTVVLAAMLLNWSSAAPGAWFRTHRVLFDHAVDTFDPDDSYYGAELPVPLRALSANGRVRRDDAGLFFPQWLGIPDDGGGYFYAPGDSPSGADMFGLVCRDPDDLGDGWWVCGM